MIVVQLMWADDRFEVEDFGERDLGRIDEGQRSIGGLEDLIVAHDGGPLERQTDVAAFVLVEARVDTMLEIAGHRDLWFLFLFREHFVVLVSLGEVLASGGDENLGASFRGNDAGRWIVYLEKNGNRNNGNTQDARDLRLSINHHRCILELFIPSKNIRVCVCVCLYADSRCLIGLWVAG